jgi:hypothetical protein
MNARVAGAIVVAIAGCSVNSLRTNEQSGAERLFALSANWPAFVQAPPGQPPRGAIDILFVVDNSTSMTPLQQQLAAGFASFMNVIDNLPGGTPDLHIGVVSSDVGAGEDLIQNCNGRGGDQGRLQFAPRGACTQTNLDPDAHFIALRTDANGSRITNYAGSALSQVFGCIAVLGDAGCGFEQPLASVKRALGGDGRPPPAENQGFLRDAALLAVVLLSNEDDCSVAPGVPLFETMTNRTISSQLGPLSSFRCNEFGHLCAGRRPPRTATGVMQDCESNESEGFLESVSSFVAFLRSIKRDPAKVFVASVAGPPTPYQVHVTPPLITDTADWPEIGHSCAGADGAFADPAVRLAQLTGSLGPYGRFESICADGMSTPLQRIATGVTAPLDRSCVARPSAEDTCQVVDRWVESDGIKQAAVLPRCADMPGATPCWSLVDDLRSCPATTAQRLRIDRGGAAIPTGLMTAIDCG